MITEAEEPRYTLDEARALLRREECERKGHQIRQISHPVPVGGSAGIRMRPVLRVSCDRCQATLTPSWN